MGVVATGPIASSRYKPRRNIPKGHMPLLPILDQKMQDHVEMEEFYIFPQCTKDPYGRKVSHRRRLADCR